MTASLQVELALLTAAGWFPFSYCIDFIESGAGNMV